MGAKGNSNTAGYAVSRDICRSPLSFGKRMRTFFSITLAVLTVAVTGCVGIRPTCEAAGVFKNKEGRRVLIEPEGHIYESEGSVAGAALHFVGIASAERKNTRKLFVNTPSASTRRWMGVTLLFNADFTGFDVFEYEPRSQSTKGPQDTYERVY